MLTILFLTVTKFKTVAQVQLKTKKNTAPPQQSGRQALA